MNTLLKIVVVIISLLVMQGTKSWAQSSGFEIDIQGNQPDFTFNTISDYENGISYPGAIQISVTAKKHDDWSISFKASNSSFQSGANTMPLNMFKVQVQGYAQKSLSTTDQELISDKPSNNNYTTTHYNVDYSMSAPGYTYDPGSYTATIIYTVSVK